MFGFSPFASTPFASILSGAVELTPALFVNTNTFYAPSVSATYNLAPALFVNTNTFYAPSVSATYTLAPALFVNTNTFYPIQLVYNQFLAPNLFVNTNVFYESFGYLYPFHPNDVRPSGPNVAGGPRGAMPRPPSTARQNMPLSSDTRQPMPYE